MARLRTLILRAPGTNTEEETQRAWRLAGAEAEILHFQQALERPEVLDSYTVLTLPGGFSYGDDIAAGRVQGVLLRERLGEAIQRLMGRGGGLFGICNGFQVLIQAGLLPGQPFGRTCVTLTGNRSGRFEARWVRTRVEVSHCPFLPAGALIDMPVEHGEGCVQAVSEDRIGALGSASRIALRYVDLEGRVKGYPTNPNGSMDSIAGLCDDTGRILGLMPHPERSADPAHRPGWTRRDDPQAHDGLSIFRAAAAYWS